MDLLLMKQLQGGSALSLSLMVHWYVIGDLDLVTNELESAQRRGFAATILPLMVDSISSILSPNKFFLNFFHNNDKNKAHGYNLISRPKKSNNNASRFPNTW